MPDHLHIFSDLHPTICLSDYIKDIKLASSSWIKDMGYFPDFPGWQVGYGAFTYTINDKAKIINYIKNQKEHHKTESSFDEYKRLLIENGIDFDIKYLYNLTPKYSTPLGLLHLCYVTTGCTRGYFDLTLSGLFIFG